MKCIVSLRVADPDQLGSGSNFGLDRHPGLGIAANRGFGSSAKRRYLTAAWIRIIDTMCEKDTNRMFEIYT